jgi:hypothetical protein
MINPFAPGGGVDGFGRPLSIYLSKALGQQFLVENLAGADGPSDGRGAKRPMNHFFLGAVHHQRRPLRKLPYSLGAISSRYGARLCSQRRRGPSQARQRNRCAT